ncbi:MAG: hypothetical protein AAGA94_12725 [Pseudomonadota bacterium]
MDQATTTAVVYFSLYGHSERAARKLAEALSADLIALRAPSYRRSVVGYIRAAVDSLRQKCDLPPQEFTSLKRYHRLVLCGPVWTSYPATPLRGLLRSDVELPAQIGLFLTSGGHSPSQKAFDTAEADLGRPLAATAALGNSVEGTVEEEAILTRFASDLDARPVSGLRSVK